MIIKRTSRNKEDGSVEVVMLLTEEQNQFLINFALGMLVPAGIAKFYNVPEEEFQKDMAAVKDELTKVKEIIDAVSETSAPTALTKEEITEAWSDVLTTAKPSDLPQA